MRYIKISLSDRAEVSPVYDTNVREISRRWSFFYIHDKVTAHGHTLRDTITTRISIAERSENRLRKCKCQKMYTEFLSCEIFNLLI